MTIWRSFTPPHQDPDEVRMTLGEHLEELRSRMIRALVGLAVGTVICFGFISQIVAFLNKPVYDALRAHGLEPEVIVLHPAEQLITDLKVAIIVGLICSAPYRLTQIWGFIAAGLYPTERRWVNRFAPISITLFFVGAFFELIVVGPFILHFMVGYRD